MPANTPIIAKSETINFWVSTADGKDGQPMNPATKGSTSAFPYFNRKKKKWSAAITNDNPKNKAWTQRVAWVAKQHALPSCPWAGAVSLSLTFVMRKPKTMPKDRISPIVKPDLDKMIRSIKDSLTKIIYSDDAQIIYIVAGKQYGETPGVQIELIDLSFTKQGTNHGA